MSWSYRPALDGLRALSMYLIILFHADVAGFDGAFIALVLFFVLSGFLVASIILDEHDRTGRVDLGTFYVRRVKRLLPAAVVAVIGTCAMTLLIFSAAERLEWIRDAQSSLLYYANWHFLSTSGDYFAADTEKSPFLHFWSLSVEEQYYFVFPLLLIGLLALRRRWAPAVVAGIAGLTLLSLGAQAYWAARDADHAYYGTDARIYQLLAGVLVALLWRRLTKDKEAPEQLVRRRRPWTLTGFSTTIVLGLFLLLCTSVVPMGVSTRGVVATVVCAALLLVVMQEGDGRVHWLLTRGPVVYLGKISYGTYLWHWPIYLALTQVLTVNPRTSAVVTMVLATGMAAVSYEILEHPIRRSKVIGAVPMPTVVGALALSLVIALTAVPAALSQGRKPAVAAPASTAVLEIEAAKDERVPDDVDWGAYRRDVGADTTYCTAEDLESCVVHRGDSGLDLAVVGDSHARQLAAAMIPLAEEHDFTLSLHVIAGCPWQAGVTTDRKFEKPEDACVPSRRDLYDGVLAELDPDVVLLAQSPRDTGSWLDKLLTDEGEQVDVLDLNVRTIKSTVRQVRALPADVVLVRSMIRPDEIGMKDPLACLSAARRTSQCRLSVPGTVHVSDSTYDVLAAGHDDVATIEVNPVLCPALPVCETMVDGVPIWRDGGHYSTEALVQHRARLWELLQETGFVDSAR